MLATIFGGNQEFTGIISPEAGLARGSVFNNLFIPYKYFTNNILKGKNERQNILAMIDIYAFLITDLSEYIDTHPNCEKAKDAINKAKIELDKLKTYYENKFGILATCSKGNSVSYINGPWPWEDLF